MASGFFVLLDDIATLMNDVATMGKIAGKKTAGILGDDLAVNAEKASGFVSERELPVLWAISKGSFLNKLIILPVAFLLSYFLSWSITAILLIGGAYLAFEGVEKILEFFFPHHHEEAKEKSLTKISKEQVLDLEKSKIKSAIITDFILSVEIVIIALGAVSEESITMQIIVVTAIAMFATVGVYGIVALIVRMDDFGYKLVANGIRQNLRSKRVVGRFFIKAMPWIIKSIAVIGTIALLLVAGGMFVHKIHFIHSLTESWPSVLAELTVGIGVGLTTWTFVKVVLWMVSKVKRS